MTCYYSNTNSTAGVVWTTWCDSTTTTTSSDCWGEWCDSGTSTTAATATAVWRVWATGSTSTGEITVRVPVYQAPQPTQEQLDDSRRRTEEAERRCAEERKKREAAEKKAEELLLANLAKEQQKQYKAERKFRVLGSDGASFEIAYGRAGNIREINKDGKPVNRFCIHPKELVPDQDTMLAQKLMLETDADTFRKIANRTPIHA